MISFLCLLNLQAKSILLDFSILMVVHKHKYWKHKDVLTYKIINNSSKIELPEACCIRREDGLLESHANYNTYSHIFQMKNSLNDVTMVRAMRTKTRLRISGSLFGAFPVITNLRNL